MTNDVVPINALDSTVMEDAAAAAPFASDDGRSATRPGETGATPRQLVDDCEPPYIYDARGVKHPKPDCD